MARKIAAIPTERRSTTRRQPRHVMQFLVVLSETDPLVWRRIQVPEKYSFWDLHVAIQDAMGWLDYHLHEFLDERPCIADWEVKIAEYFSYESKLDAPPALYVYDFGDDWHHILLFESIVTADASATYPRCIAGARACPPEDCGGVGGFVEFLEAIADPKHEEHDHLVAWSGGAYDPAAFDPSRVTFDNPRQRWKKAFLDDAI